MRFWVVGLFMWVVRILGQCNTIDKSVALPGDVTVCGQNGTLCQTLTQLANGLNHTFPNGTNGKAGSNGTCGCPCKAVTFTMTFNTINNIVQTGPLPTTENYTVQGITVTAAGYRRSNNSAVNMYSRADPGDEKGIGINEVGGTHEVTIDYYIQIDFGALQAVASELLGTVPQIIIDSAQAGELWSLYVGNVSGQIGKWVVTSNADDTAVPVPLWPQNRYLSISMNTSFGDVLIRSLVFTTCQPQGLVTATYRTTNDLTLTDPFATNPRLNDGQLAVLIADPVYPDSLWMWQQSSAATPSAVIIKPTLTSALDPGRWLKLNLVFG